MKKILIIVIIFTIIVNAQNPLNSIIPQDRIINWANSGLQISKPVFYDRILDVCVDFNVKPTNSKTANSQGLVNAINYARTLSGWKCIFFSQAGTYNFGSTVNLTNLDSYLVFKGINSSSVILYFEIGGFASDIFNVSGSLESEITTLNTSNYYKGDSEIYLSQQRTDLVDNNWIKLWDDRLSTPSWAKVGQVIQIGSNPTGNALQLKDKLSINYPNTTNRYVQKIVPIKNIGFEDLTIKRAGSDGTFHYGLSASIRFNFAVNCWVYGVESWGSQGWHICIENSSHIWLHGNFIHHSNSYREGEGYGIVLQERSTNCLIENNIINFLRHSILLQSSSNRNVIAYNYSYDRYCEVCDPIDGTGDISIHGTFSHANLFEGNIVEYIYADDSDDHGSNGPFNTIFRNIVIDGNSLNDIDLELLDYVNLVGNKCDDVDFNSSNFKLDIYGINSNNGLFVSHSEYGGNRAGLEPVVYWPDYSYYLTQKPSWMSTSFSWPPIGPRISVYSSYLTQSNPAQLRHLSGGKKTLSGNPIIVAPIISTLTSNPSPICQGSWATITCNLFQGEIGSKYYWSAVDFPSNYVFQTFGVYADYCKILIPNNAVADMGHIPKVRCTVINFEGNDTKELQLTVGVCGGGCPFVYTWNGNAWVVDNNILPQSQDEAILGQDVIDYYQLYTEPKLESKPTGDRYYLSVGEFEEEKSYLDQLKLLVIDHSSDSYITVDDNGEIIQFIKPAYFASAELDSEDVYKKLLSLDNNPAEISESETLSLTFEDVSNNTENWLLLVAHSINAKEKIAGNILTKRNGIESTFSSFRLRENPTYQWVLVPQCSTNTLQVDINWEVSAEADYAELSRKVNLPFNIYTPLLIKAEHTTQGEITNTVIQNDANYAILNNGEMISLEFEAPALDPNKDRSFIFVSKGRYEHISNNKLNKPNEMIIIPTENKLYDCYPNPFNPTTRIKYALKDEGKVTLKIFNSLGEEISTLVSEVKSAGNYEAEFNASTLPSGVYIYSI